MCKVHHLIWIRGCMGEGKSHMTDLRVTVVKYLYFTASLWHRICRTVITWASPSGCNLTSAAHLLLCSTKPKPIPALNCSQGLAGLSERGWGSSSSEKPVGWKWGEGSQSQSQLGTGTCSVASQTNVVFYWLVEGALLGSMLQTHTFLMCRCPPLLWRLSGCPGWKRFMLAITCIFTSEME